jgi:ATP-binding cassette subfamily F protein 3
MYLQVSGLTKSFAGSIILDNISFSISGNEKVGLLGKNGSGKSTLFKLIVGHEEIDSGSVIISPEKTVIGYLPQTDLLMNDNRLSSGERVKKQLKNILEQKPNILLLDEPTNHLDWKGLVWLEEMVNNFSGAVLVTSHDRKFLDNTVSKIIELDNGKIKIYGGNYSFYKNQKTTEELANLKKYQDQRKRINKLEERVRILKNQTQQLEVKTTGADHYKRRKAAKAASAAINMQKRIAKEIKALKINQAK